MNSKLDEQMQKARQDIARFDKIEAMQSELYSERTVLEQKAAELKAVLVKENLDVNRLEEKSLSSLFYAMLGNREEKIDKERGEALAAKLKYDQAEIDLEDIKFRMEKLISERRELENSRAEYDRLFELKINELLRENSDNAHKILEFTEKIGFLKSRINEVFEAASVGNQVLGSLDDAAGRLDSAAGWGTFDLLGGGFIANVAKHSYIDEARAKMEEAQMLLRSFRTELADIKIGADIGIETGGFAMFADFFFDGLIADWYMQSRINQSMENIHSVMQRVSDVVGRLEQMGNSDKAEIDSLENALTDLIVNG